MMTHCNTVVQAVVDDDHRGRVMASAAAPGGSLPLGGLLLGTVWHLVGPYRPAPAAWSRCRSPPTPCAQPLRCPAGAANL